MPLTIDVERPGRLSYEAAYALQLERHAAAMASREAGSDHAGTLLALEHDPVITVSNRPGAAEHVLASSELLARHGVALARTDRGGDVTYHGPGQVVVYTVIDLKRLRVGLHEHLRIMEEAVISTLGVFGVRAGRDESATGVWVGDGPSAKKICAMGVRVRRWIALHGLALNVTTDLRHFELIVPCGLVGRPVTSLRAELGDGCPPWDTVADRLTDNLRRRFLEDASDSSDVM